VTDILLDVQAIEKHFGGLVAVNSVDLQIERGMIASLIGPNGAGKTTFFNCVTGFYTPEVGDMLFKGQSIYGLRTDQIAQRGVARTYQNIRLFGNMTVLENILIGMHIHLKSSPLGAVLGTPFTRREEQRALDEAMQLLHYVSLDGQGDLLAANLPYGLQRRLEIARALALKPELLLLDEPTAGMNPNETEVMMNFIRRLRDELDLTIFLIEHDMKLVMSISDQVSVMDHGMKISEGTPGFVQRDPAVIKAYLGSGPAEDMEQDQQAQSAPDNVEVKP